MSPIVCGIIWLIVMIVMVVIEFMTVQFITIWFAGGAVAGIITALCGASFSVQLYTFLGVSIVLLVATRSYVMKKINSKPTEKTNSDALIGKVGVVTQPVDNVKQEGRIAIDGQSWSGRSTVDTTIINENEKCTVVRIEGVHLVVEPYTE